MAGEEVGGCNCAWGCPCQFNALPTNGSCEGFGVCEVEEGYFGSIQLAGVRFCGLYSWSGPIHEGDGTMLDHSLFLYGSGISDSNIHAYNDLPIALIGGKAVGIKGGRYVRYADKTPLANLYVTLLGKFGLNIDAFGDSKGPLPNVTLSNL